MGKSSLHVLVSGRVRGDEAGLARVEHFFRTVAQRLRVRMVSRVSDEFEVRLRSLEVRPSDDIASHSDFTEDSIFQLIGFSTLPTSSVMYMERALLSRIIGAMLGDIDSEEPKLDAARPLSPVDVRIAGRMFRDVLSEVKAVWPGDSGPGVRDIGGPGNLRTRQPHTDRGEVYVASYDLGVAGRIFGLILVTLPVELMRDIIEDSTAEAGIGEPARNLDYSKVLPVSVELVAELSRVSMSVRELRALAEGDIIQLGVVNETVVRANGRRVFIGEPGHSGGQRSVCVAKRVA